MAHSNFDRRRVNGPEESFLPVFAPEESSDKWKLGQPRSNRGLSDIRPIFLQPGLISQANGSAYIETEQTKIACAIYGPRQSKNTAYSENGRLNVEVKFAPFSCRRRRAPLRDAEDRTIAMAIHQAIVSSVRLELLPKSTIDVFITVIEADGIESAIASASVAVSTALADAGIEILGLVVSCSASIVGKEIWLDPNEDEIASSQGTIILSCIPALGTVTSVWQNGRMSSTEAADAMEACQDRCTDIHGIVAQALREYSGQ
ncbi:ribosomal protein S5 domain 2-like protein [Macrolepiota fuliginosa MF-IS2]|uniref:Ribosomal protein S5 domain 2-like protein n=1 Tax=Macrolepiota fuliginosa MF-IS2 TaxID=1400762 RepID=A0A9P5XPF3_9AGAR|nr:ribosomal protein S5 domain 2-like protein [Macrolepiota fuliginosa MF-IS2]